MPPARRKALKRLRQAEDTAVDLEAAQEGLAGAIRVLKKSKPALVQVAEARKTVEDVAALADAIGLESDKQAVSAFLLQDPGVLMKNYKFKSDAIVEPLKELVGILESTE